MKSKDGLMGKFILKHEIHCNADRFWKTHIDRQFNEQLYREVLGFPQYDIVDQHETDREIRRKCVGQPKLNMPGPIVKLLGPGFRYTEEDIFDKSTSIWRWKTIPSALADKLLHEGVLRLEPIGEDRVRRVAEILIEARVFGLRGLLESTTEKEIRQGWDASAVFMNKWLAEHG
jgi:hypothetical protein